MMGQQNPFFDGFFDWSAPPDEPEKTSLPVAQSEHAIATHHSAQAAQVAAKTRVAKTIALRRLLERAGRKGMSDWEIQQETGWVMGTVCSTRNRLRHALWPADREGVSPSGVPVTCWRLATAAEMDSKKRAAQSALPATDERK